MRVRLGIRVRACGRTRTRRAQKGLEAQRARVEQCAQRGRVARIGGHQPAPEPYIHPLLALRMPWELSESHARGSVQLHAEPRESRQGPAQGPASPPRPQADWAGMRWRWHLHTTGLVTPDKVLQVATAATCSPAECLIRGTGPVATGPACPHRARIDGCDSFMHRRVLLS